MVALRSIGLLLLFTCVVSFALFAITGQQRFKRFGLRVLKLTLALAAVFFGVLILERVL